MQSVAAALDGRDLAVADPTRWTTAELFAAHGDSIYRTARFLGVPAQDVDDIVQEVFLAAHRGLAGFEGRSTPRTWLHGICLRVVAAWRRRKARTAETGPLEIASEAVGPEDAIDIERSRRLLIATLERLPECQRAAFVLHEIEGLSIRDVAGLTETSPSTAQYRVEKAREMVSRAVARVARGGL